MIFASESAGQIIIASVRREHGKCLIFVTGLSLQASMNDDTRSKISYPSMNLTELSIDLMYLRKLQSRRFLLVAPPLKGYSGAKITTHVFSIIFVSRQAYQLTDLQKTSGQPLSPLPTPAHAYITWIEAHLTNASYVTNCI